MDLWHLSIFCKVVEQKSFSRAGSSVRLSQPTVSSHVRDLETHFNCRLIDRLAKEAVPTEAGRILYRYASRLLALKDEMETALAEFHGSMQGRLQVGGSTLPGTYILPRVIGAFSEAYPKVTVSLRIGDTRSIVDDTLEGIVALGVVGAKVKDARIVQEPVAQDTMGLVVFPDHPWSRKTRVDLKALSTEPFILREAGSGTRASLEESLIQNGMRLQDFNIVAEMGSTEAIRQGIKSRLGVSILSQIAVEEDLRNGELRRVPVEGLSLKRGVYLTFHRHRTLSPLAAAFSDFLKAVLNPGDASCCHRKDRKPKQP